MIAVLIFIAFGLGMAYLILRDRHRKLAREAFIRDYVFPQGLFAKLQGQHPQLSLKQCQLVSRGLRQFFLTHHKSGLQFVSMPSQIVDDLWHEFILHTREYERFCKQAFGSFMHHTPAVVLGNARQQANAGLRRCWWWACRDENINPLRPTRLPLLFALDDKLKISNGFRYAADCDAVRRLDATGGGTTIIHCGGDFASPSFDGSTEGLGPTRNNDSTSGTGTGCGGGSSADGSTGSASAAGDGAGGGGSSGGASGDGCGGGGCGGGGD